jgi:hypothetical protein
VLSSRSRILTFTLPCRNNWTTFDSTIPDRRHQSCCPIYVWRSTSTILHCKSSTTIPL